MPPRVDTAHRRRRPDATLLTVLAIFLAGAIGAVAVGVAAPVPSQVAGPGPSSAGRPGFSDDVPTGPDGPFSFLAVTYVDGQREPVRWNPCQPIEYQLDVAHGPPETASAISGALDLASGASGISFRFDGTVDRGFAAMRHGRYLLDPIRSVYRPVLIEVVPHATFRTYRVPKRVLAFTHPEKGVQGHDDQWVSGYVVVDGGVRYARTGRWSMELVIAHELGHLLGLGHVAGARRADVQPAGRQGRRSPRRSTAGDRATSRGSSGSAPTRAACRTSASVADHRARAGRRPKHRRTCRYDVRHDGPRRLLHHHADLLRERRAPYRNRVQRRRHRRDRALPPAPRRGRLPSDGDRRAWAEGAARRRGERRGRQGVGRPARAEVARGVGAARHRLRRLHTHHRAAAPRRGGQDPQRRARQRPRRHLPRATTRACTASTARRTTRSPSSSRGTSARSTSGRSSSSARTTTSSGSRRTRTGCSSTTSSIPRRSSRRPGATRCCR